MQLLRPKSPAGKSGLGGWWSRLVGGRVIDSAAGLLPIVRDLRTPSRRPSDDSRVEWTPNTLRMILQNDLPDAEVIVVSNREPYIHNQEDGRIVVHTPASGLVAALEPIMAACGGTWIATGSGSADRETVDEHDRLRVPVAKPAYTLRRVWLSEAEEDGYYYGLANEGLWPLCHLAYVRPHFVEANWAMYWAVNEKFANAVVEEATGQRPIVLIQDYHFALLPRMVRERLPEATIITFWHIPWPNPETFSICPWRAEVLQGLLGSSILGFHTQFHCNNFIDTVDRFLESRIDREQRSITLGGQETLVRPYPISIEWPPKVMETQGSIAACQAAVRARFDLPPEVRLAVGIERFDYTKGILDRMKAIDLFLTEYPEWRGRFCFIQAAAPTRTKLASYRALEDESIALAAEINAQHTYDGVPAIILTIRHHEQDEVFELYRAADLCIVSSLHDGMNLVAKEFVGARDDQQGVLILSTFAGAARELTQALIVNPYDTKEMARAIQQALLMPPEEQQARTALLRDMVRENNVYRWAGRMLHDAARIRRHGLIDELDTSSGDNRRG